MVRLILALALGTSLCIASDAPAVSLRGTLDTGKQPTIETADHHRVALSGDESTMLVLHDSRLKGTDFEVLGHYTDPAHFAVDPIHTTSLFVHKDGKRLAVTYFCHTCNIRSYTPGKCVCCQQETDVDLVDPKDR